MENSWENKNRQNKKPTNKKNAAVSNQLMNGWRGEEENGRNMPRE